jgi:hypothetical protein
LRSAANWCGGGVTLELPPEWVEGGFAFGGVRLRATLGLQIGSGRQSQRRTGIGHPLASVRELRQRLPLVGQLDAIVGPE